MVCLVLLKIFWCFSGFLVLLKVFFGGFVGVLIEFYRVSSVFFPGFAFRVIFWSFGALLRYLLGIYFF